MRWTRRRIAAVAAGVLVVVGIALALSGAARGIALYAYLLLLTLAAVLAVRARMRRAWPPTPRFERLLPPRPAPGRRVHQLESLVGRLSGGYPSAYDLYARIRPLAHEIAAARLVRAHGVDLDESPERAERLLGPRTWQLVRPDVAPPQDPWSRTWTPRELNELLAELEAL